MACVIRGICTVSKNIEINIENDASEHRVE